MGPNINILSISSMLDVYVLHSIWCNLQTPRTPQLLDGFKTELQGRVHSITNARGELEKLFAMRVDDAVIDEPEHSEHKEKCMVAIRNCEASFTSYAGSVRSIKAVVATFINSIICVGIV